MITSGLTLPLLYLKLFIYLKVHSFIFIHMYKGCFVVSQLFVQRNEIFFFFPKKGLLLARQRGNFTMRNKSTADP